MKTIIFSSLMMLTSYGAYARDCKEVVLGAAIQLEATRADAKGFSEPIGAHLDVTGSDEEIWVATIVGNDGVNVGYTIKVNSLTCEVLEEPVRGR